MLAAFFASMVVVGLAGLAMVAIGVGPRTEHPAVVPPLPTPAGLCEPQGIPSPVESNENVREKPIEEILAESGEDPGAVYYTSRVREAIREGNPAFARELLRQMKEAYSKSVLIDEAEALFEKGKERS